MKIWRINPQIPRQYEIDRYSANDIHMIFFYEHIVAECKTSNRGREKRVVAFAKSKIPDLEILLIPKLIQNHRLCCTKNSDPKHILHPDITEWIFLSTAALVNHPTTFVCHMSEPARWVATPTRMSRDVPPNPRSTVRPVIPSTTAGASAGHTPLSRRLRIRFANCVHLIIMMVLYYCGR